MKFWNEKIRIGKRQISIKKIILLMVLGLICYTVIFNLSIPQTYTGRLERIEFFPKSNNPGSDAVLYFKINDTYHYLVLNEYRTGMMVELEYKLGKKVTVHYKTNVVGETRNMAWNFEEV